MCPHIHVHGNASVAMCLEDGHLESTFLKLSAHHIRTLHAHLLMAWPGLAWPGSGKRPQCKG